MHNTQVGIYLITNIINGKVYVGSSIELWQRWSDHQYCLGNGTRGKSGAEHNVITANGPEARAFYQRIIDRADALLPIFSQGQTIEIDPDSEEDSE